MKEMCITKIGADVQNHALDGVVDGASPISTRRRSRSTLSFDMHAKRLAGCPASPASRFPALLLPRPSPYIRLPRRSETAGKRSICSSVRETRLDGNQGIGRLAFTAAVGRARGFRSARLIGTHWVAAWTPTRCDLMFDRIIPDPAAISPRLAAAGLVPSKEPAALCYCRFSRFADP